MALSPLHRLAELIRHGDYIEDKELRDLLGEDGIIVIPLTGGGERHLPSGEILSVLADGAGRSIDEVLARSFRLSPAEIDSARSFIDLVQFAGEGEPPDKASEAPEQAIQPFDR